MALTHFETEVVAVARALGWPDIYGDDPIRKWVAMGWMRDSIERLQRLEESIREAALEVIGAERAGANIDDPHWCLGWLASAAGQADKEARDAEEAK